MDAAAEWMPQQSVRSATREVRYARSKVEWQHKPTDDEGECCVRLNDVPVLHVRLLLAVG